MRPALAAAALVAPFALLGGSVEAAVVLRASPREMADASQCIVEGRVTKIETRWDRDRTCIFRYAKVKVASCLKGSEAGEVVVKVPGGRVGEDEVRYEGGAEFREGEEVVVFLWKDRDGDYLVVGEAQGKFNLVRDGKGAVIAANSLKGLCLVVRPDAKAKAAGSPGAVPPQRPDRLPYGELRAVVAASNEAAARARTGTGTTSGRGTTTSTGSGGATTTGGGAAPTGGGTTSSNPPTPAPDGTTTTGTGGPAEEPAPAPTPPPVVAAEGAVTSVSEGGAMFDVGLGTAQGVVTGSVLEVLLPSPEGWTVKARGTVNEVREAGCRAVVTFRADGAAPVAVGDRIRVGAPAAK